LEGFFLCFVDRLIVSRSDGDPVEWKSSREKENERKKRRSNGLMLQMLQKKKAISSLTEKLEEEETKSCDMSWKREG